MYKFGSVLRALSIFWCFGAIFRILIAVADSSSRSVKVHFLLLLLGLATFAIGSWLCNRKKTSTASKRVAVVKSKWWQSDYGFRLSVFIGTSWAISAFIWQDSYDRNYSTIFGPAAAMLALYFGYKHFVVGSPASVFQHEPATGNNLDNDELIHSSSEPETLNEKSSMSSADREKSMDELIRLMKSNS